MAGIEDLRARQVTAALLRSADDAAAALLRAGFSGYQHEKGNPTAWTSPELYAAYVDLAARIAAARQSDLELAPMKVHNCLSCRHFAALKSSRAHEAPVPIDGIVETGYCTAHPPQRMSTNVMSDPAGSSNWVHVHGHHVCGEWLSVGRPRGGW